MRKLLAVLVMLALLGMCSASFGYILVYNVSTTVNGVDDATKVTIPLKGYLVVNLDDSDELQDANLILYGQDSNIPKKQKVYVQLNNSDSNGFLHIDAWRQGDYTFVDLWSYTSPFDFEALMMGKVSSKDVGLGTNNKKPVASSLKGVFMAWEGMLLDLDQDIAGTSNISSTLNNAYTKSINDPLETWSQDEVIEGKIINGKEQGIKPILEGKHYEEVSLPSP